MNAILESSVLEALAFNYSSFGIANIVWTWVAVVTAAVSFWRIKVSSSTLPPPPEPTLVTSSSSPSQVERLVQLKESTSPTPASTMMSADAAFLVKEEGTKGKLTVYFKQDEDGECNNDGEGGDQEGEDESVELSKEWFQNWEILLKLRKGERGWYCYQDMKVIDGSVVRLWEGRREAEKTAFSFGVVSAR
ncbi:uncharacterized protein LOC129892200 [Solanum dulcamara]|uniref:uncharacterized protein LOC129892200 n=1 Tax=Solanum dulcamara TaxID=45834 RepID=UPI0024856EA2|nr:uncharacterized protein LOC129892200 [Solanum dulcamara]